MDGSMTFQDRLASTIQQDKGDQVKADSSRFPVIARSEATRQSPSECNGIEIASLRSQ
jgi:hypothetical protein